MSVYALMAELVDLRLLLSADPGLLENAGEHLMKHRLMNGSAIPYSVDAVDQLLMEGIFIK